MLNFVGRISFLTYTIFVIEYLGEQNQNNYAFSANLIF